ncbi:MAG: hypothetical protein AAF810_24560 [Cyanobacteria bacterium P01_D01_bin.36]
MAGFSSSNECVGSSHTVESALNLAVVQSVVNAHSDLKVIWQIKVIWQSGSKAIGSLE